MALSYVAKVRGALDLFMRQDDKKLDAAEISAVISVGTSRYSNKLTNASMRELSSVYREGADSFVASADYNRMAQILLANGAKAVDLGITGGRDTFDHLTNPMKMVALFGVDPGYSFDPKSEFSQTDVRLVDTLSGPVLERALDAYHAARENSYMGGGGSPEVKALSKDGEIYAYTIYTTGEDPQYSAGWAFLDVYDRDFNPIGNVESVE